MQKITTPRRILGAALTTLLAAGIAVAPSAEATSSTTNLRLNGGDVLQVNAWHCGTYVSSCSWKTSTKVLGSHPLKASSVTNASQLQAHGWGGSISLGSSWNVTITGSSHSLVSTRWTNTNAWISDSGGVVKPGWATAWVSTRATGSARHPIFGSPSNVQAYAGAF